MGLKYVLNSMKRRKLRTLIISIALTVGVALVGALLALVDTQRQFSMQSVGSQTGGYDLSINKSDVAATPFFTITDVETIATAVDAKIASMHARIQASAEARKIGATDGQAVTFVAINPSTDNLVSLAQSTNTNNIGIGGIRISIGNTGGGRGLSGGGRQGGGPPGGQGGGFQGGGPPGDQCIISTNHQSGDRQKRA